MNALRISIDVRCSEDQARSLVAEFDHVSYGSDTGVATVTIETTGSDHLLAAAGNGLDRVEEVLGAAGLSYDAVVNIGLDTEALVEDGGAWRRPGEVVPTLPIKLNDLGE